MRIKNLEQKEVIEPRTKISEYISTVLKEVKARIVDL